MFRVIVLFLLMTVTFDGTAQTDEQIIIAPNFPLVATIPADWIFMGARGEAVMEFQTDNFQMQVFVSSQTTLSAEGINPNDLDAAIKLYPFQPYPSGRRSLSAAGWAYQTIEFEHKGVPLVIRDYTTGDPPMVEMIRVLDNGMVLLAKFNFSEVDYAESETWVDVFTKIRMPTHDEYACTLADMGDVPVYTAMDSTSETLEIDLTTPVISLSVDEGMIWYRLQDGGFVNDDDANSFETVELDTSAPSLGDCRHVPIAAERVPEFDPANALLTETYHLPDGYILQYPATGGWEHIDNETVLKNGILHVSFGMNYLDELDHWRSRSEDQPPPDGEDCIQNATYTEDEIEGTTITRLEVVNTCSTYLPSPYQINLAVQRDDQAIVVATITPVFPERPIRDVRIVERILGSLRLGEVGESTCTAVTTEAATVYDAPSLEAAVIETLPIETQIEIQAAGDEDDNEDVWWVQLTSGAWLPT